MASELKPTPKTIDSVCLSYRHDFGLLDEASKRPIRSEALWWFEAWQKEGYFVTRPAPAATDTGLVTVAWQDFVPSFGWVASDPSSIAKDKRELVTRSQAEELLAAERAEKEKERLRFEGDLDKWMKIIGAGITGYQPEAYALMDFACEELVKLRADYAAQAARIKALEQVNAKLCDDAIDYELKIAERDVSLNELKQKLADKFSFTSDDDALAVLERYGHKETGNGIIKADMRSLDDMCRAAVAYLCAEWDFVFQDEVELNRETLGAKLAAAVKALEEADEALQADAIASAHAAIRAVLGGKL